MRVLFIKIPIETTLVKNNLYSLFSDLPRRPEDQTADERFHGLLTLPAAEDCGDPAGHPQRRDLQAAGPPMEGDDGG